MKPCPGDFLASLVFLVLVYEFKIGVGLIVYNDISRIVNLYQSIYRDGISRISVFSLRLHICHKFGKNVDKEWHYAKP